MSIVSDNYLVRQYNLLPNPSGIPFHIQGQPIPDPLQKHTEAPQGQTVRSAYNTANDLAPSGRFMGTVWPQQNQPRFLGANERVVFEGTW